MDMSIYNQLKGRPLLSLADLSPAEIETLLEAAATLKQQAHRGVRQQRLRGRTLAMLFEKPSTRTRCAFETAFGEEGGHPVFLSKNDIQLGSKESVEDTARVLGRMFDCIQFRGFKQEHVRTLAEYSGVPVFNGLTDQYHPTQALADVLTLQEQRGSLEGAQLAYVGDGRNNVARSLMITGAKLGFTTILIAPRELQPEAAFLDMVNRIAAKEHPVTVSETIRAVAGSDAIYTDVWASMGEEELFQQRAALLQPYQVNEAVMSAAESKDVIFLHCLPAQKGHEVTEAVFESNRSRVWDQAENRKHTIKAVIFAALGIPL